MNLFSSFVRRDRTERELDEEVRSYHDILVERHMARGLSREAAMRAAHVEFGGTEQVKERVRAERAGVYLETTLKDIQFACRTLVKNPGFTVTAVLTLGLGIGANTAIFSLINAVMLRLLPVQHPEQLVLLTDPADDGVAVDTTQHGERTILSYPEFQQLRANTTVFSGLIAAQDEVSAADVYPMSGSEPLRARVQLVSGDFFRLLGVLPISGRVFDSSEDEVAGANHVAVVSYEYWKRALASDPKVVGSMVRVGHGVFQIVGIGPAGFGGILVGSPADLWFPITMQKEVLPGRDYLTPRDTLWLQVMGRLGPGMSLKKAEAGVSATFQQVLQGWAADLPTPRERREKLNERIKLRPGGRGASALRDTFADPLLQIMAIAGAVLLVACANLANLMLARASGRQQEIGVRLALGAARSRLIRQLLTESLILALVGGALGIVLSSVATRLLLALVSTSIDNLGLDVPRDNFVLAFTAVVATVTALLFGLAPAVRGTRLDVHRTLAAQARGSVGDRGRNRTGKFLGVLQVALSLVLLMGAAMFVHSLYNMLGQAVGYDRDHLLMINIDHNAAGYRGANATTMYEALRERLGGIPGVRRATLSRGGLFAGDSGDHLSIEGTEERDPEKLTARWTEVGAGYFSTLKIPLLLGREIDSGDVLRGAPVCVINESFLRRFFPQGGAIGRHIRDEYPTTREKFEIIGVAADALEHRPTEKKSPRFYANISHPIGTVESVTYLLSVSGEPSSVMVGAQHVLKEFDRDLPIVSVRTVNEQLDRRLLRDRLLADLAAFFGVLALLIAAVGLYGLMSYSIAKRTSEIGIRIALGASPGSVAGMVLGETLGIVGIGVAMGLPCGFAIARLISSRLYGVGAGDPVTMGAALLLLVAGSAVAGYVPARRASRMDPMLALRSE